MGKQDSSPEIAPSPSSYRDRDRNAEDDQHSLTTPVHFLLRIGGSNTAKTHVIFAVTIGGFVGRARVENKKTI